MEKNTHKNNINISRIKEKPFLIIILIGFIFLISINFTSAADFDNWKSFDKDVGEYGKVTIYNWNIIGKIFDIKLAELELKYNMDTPCSSCSSKIEIVMYKEGILIDDIIFETLQDDGSWVEEPIRDYKFYVKVDEQIIDVDIKEYQCSNGEFNSKNNSYKKVCEFVKVGTRKEVKEILEEYNLGEEVYGNSSGIKYYVDLEGKKDPTKTVDWKISSQGKLISEWITWNGVGTLDIGLVAYYELEEPSGTANSTVFGINLTNNTAGVPTFQATGKINFAYDFSASPINNTLLGILPSGNEDLSMACWVNKDVPEGNAGIIGLGDNTPAGESMNIIADSSKWTFNGGSGNQFLMHDSIIVGGNWYYLVATYDSGTDLVVTYVNGTNFANTTLSTGTNLNDYLELGGLTWVASGNLIGLLDECGVWNRTLNSSEIQALYNNGDGLQFQTREISVQLNKPDDDFLSSSSNIIFNCSASVSPPETVKNISLWDNRTGTYVLNETEDFTGIGGANNVSIFNKNISDGTFDWTCRGFDTDGNSAWGINRTITIDAGDPIVNIIFPTGIVNYGKQDFNISLNWTVSDANLDTCLYSYNNTNTTVVCLDLNTTVTLQENQQNITFRANDTVNNIGSDFIEWDYLVFENSRTFNLSITETSIESFILNVNVLDGFNIQKAELIYNNTIFSDSTIIDLGGGNFNVIRSITIPQGNSGFSTHNNTWFYNLTIANNIEGNTTSFGTAISEQKVNELSFGFCDQSGLDIAMLNFTYINELDGIEINSSKNRTTFQATFLIGLNSENLIKTIPINNISVNSSRYNFCTAEDTNRFVIDMQLFYTAEGFTDKNYFLNLAPLTNITNEINLFLIDEGVGVEFFIDVEQNLFSLTGATISISKFFVGEGVFKTVEIDTTNGNGEITAFLDLNKDYRFTITKDGELLGILDKRAICDAAPCELTLSITDATPDVYSGFSEIFASQVLYNLSFNSGTKVVTFEFIDITGLATSFRMDITRGSPNGTGQLISTQRLFTSSGSLTFDASNESGDLTARVFITRSPDQLIDFITFIISEVTEVLGILGLFVAFLIVVTIIFGFAFSPPMLIMSIPLSLTLVKLMGIISLSNGAIVVIYLLAIVATTFISR